jgi:hypothetical protein
MTNSHFEALSRDRPVLVAIKLLHTAIWAFFVACILALPLAAALRRFDWALLLSVLVLIECGVLALNRRRCPLTGLAAHYTSDRGDAFDIYLPNWLARHNQAIFGTLFVVNELIVLWRWLS